MKGKDRNLNLLTQQVGTELTAKDGHCIGEEADEIHVFRVNSLQPHNSMNGSLKEIKRRSDK
jgi:hypothetical protein